MQKIWIGTRFRKRDQILKPYFFLQTEIRGVCWSSLLPPPSYHLQSSHNNSTCPKCMPFAPVSDITVNKGERLQVRWKGLLSRGNKTNWKLKIQASKHMFAKCKLYLLYGRVHEKTGLGLCRFHVIFQWRRFSRVSCHLARAGHPPGPQLDVSDSQAIFVTRLRSSVGTLTPFVQPFKAWNACSHN